MGARWPALVGVLVALIIHAAIVMALFWYEPETGARAPGAGGIEVGLGQTGGTLPGAEAIAPANAETEQASDAVESVEPAVTKPEATRTKAVKAEPVAPVTADADEAEVAAAVDDGMIAEPAESTPADTVEARSASVDEPTAQAEQAEVSETQTTETETAPTATTEPAATAPAEAAPADTPEEVASNQVGASGSDGQSGQQTGEGAGQEDNIAAGGDLGAKADYTDRVQAHLARHKEYPRRARQQRDEGVTEVTFTFNRSGEILDYRISAASDHPILDRATRRMMERANPLPAMSDAVPGEQMTLTVPVAYKLR